MLTIAYAFIIKLEKLDTYFRMKPGSIGPPDMYLGAKIQKVQLENGVWTWSSSSSKYVQQAEGNFKTFLKENCLGKLLPTQATAPWP